MSELLDEGEKYVVIQANPQEKVEFVLKEQKDIIKNYAIHDEKFEVKMDFADIPMLNKSLVGAGIRCAGINS